MIYPNIYDILETVMKMKTISERLKEALKIRHMKAIELSRMTGIDRGSISNYIYGRYEPKQKAIYLMSQALNVNEAWLMGHDVDMYRPSDKPTSTGTVRLIDGVAAGSPIFAEDNIVGYIPTDVRNADECFGLIVRGESMINASIPDGARIIVHMQNTAEDGQIIVCRVNRDDATLKRFKRLGDHVLLMPENPLFEPIIVPARDFETGDAEIVGVVRQVIIDI